MKKIVQNLLAVFLLAVLLVPVTALGAEAECKHRMPETADWTWTLPSTPGSGFASCTVKVQCLDCGKEFSTVCDRVAIWGGEKQQPALVIKL